MYILLDKLEMTPSGTPELRRRHRLLAQKLNKHSKIKNEAGLGLRFLEGIEGKLDEHKEDFIDHEVKGPFT